MLHARLQRSVDHDAVVALCVGDAGRRRHGGRRVLREVRIEDLVATNLGVAGVPDLDARAVHADDAIELHERVGDVADVDRDVVVAELEPLDGSPARADRDGGERVAAEPGVVGEARRRAADEHRAEGVRGLQPDRLRQRHRCAAVDAVRELDGVAGLGSHTFTAVAIRASGTAVEGLEFRYYDIAIDVGTDTLVQFNRIVALLQRGRPGLGHPQHRGSLQRDPRSVPRAGHTGHQ